MMFIVWLIAVLAEFSSSELLLSATCSSVREQVLQCNQLMGDYTTINHWNLTRQQSCDGLRAAEGVQLRDPIPGLWNVDDQTAWLDNTGHLFINRTGTFLAGIVRATSNSAPERTFSVDIRMSTLIESSDDFDDYWEVRSGCCLDDPIVPNAAVSMWTTFAAVRGAIVEVDIGGSAIGMPIVVDGATRTAVQIGCGASGFNPAFGLSVLLRVRGAPYPNLVAIWADLRPR